MNATLNPNVPDCRVARSSIFGVSCMRLQQMPIAPDLIAIDLEVIQAPIQPLDPACHD